MEFVQLIRVPTHSYEKDTLRDGVRITYLRKSNSIQKVTVNKHRKSPYKQSDDAS